MNIFLLHELISPSQCIVTAFAAIRWIVEDNEYINEGEPIKNLRAVFLSSSFLGIYFFY